MRLELTVILVSGFGAAFLALVFIYFNRLRKELRKYFSLTWKNSKNLMPNDITGARPYNEYYYERESDIQLSRLVERRRNALILGASLSGKSRAVYNCLKNLKKSIDILSIRPVFIPHFYLPRHFRFWKEKAIFIDDFHYFAEKQESFYLLLKSVKESGTMLIAACRSGNEFKKVKSKLAEQNIDIENVFGKNIIEPGDLSEEAGREIASRAGVEWTKAGFDGSIGSVFLRLGEMKQSFESCNNAEKIILRALKNLYICGVSDEGCVFNPEEMKIAAAGIEPEAVDIELTGILKNLQQKGFIKIEKTKRIRAEEAYLENTVKTADDKNNIEIFNRLIDVFRDSPAVLCRIGERAFDTGIIDALPGEYMKAVIRAFELIKESLVNEPLKIKAKLYLGKAYWNLSRVENTIDNSTLAISYFEDIINNIDKDKMPLVFAGIKSRIGNTFMAFDETDNKTTNCKKAINAYNEALQVFTYAAHPVEFARTYNNLGGAYLVLAGAENPADNFKNAIECFKKALEVRTENEYPEDYALTKNNLGNTFFRLSAYENPAHNLRLALSCYEDALSVYSKKEETAQYGTAMNNSGNAFSNLAIYENKKFNLEKAIGAYEEAIKARTPDSSPLQFSRMLSNLGNAYLELSALTNDSLHIEKAIESFIRILNVMSIEKYPLYFGNTEYVLGKAYLKLALTVDKSENYTRAIKAFDQSLRVFDHDTNPEMYNKIQNEITQAKKIFFV